MWAHATQASRIKSHQDTPQVDFCRGFTDPREKRDKSIHRSIYSPSEIIYTVSLPKPSLRLSLTRHIPKSSSDLECRTQDPQTRSIWPRPPALPGTDWALSYFTDTALTGRVGAEGTKALWTQVHVLHEKGCFCTKPSAGLGVTDECYCAGSSNSNKLPWFMIATQPP